MLKKLKHQFVATTLLAIIFLVALLISTINFFNFRTLTKNADELLQMLSVNKGEFGDLEPKPEISVQDSFDFSVTPELPYETRFFYVSFSKDGKIIKSDTEHIAAVDKNEAENIAKKLLYSEEENGFYSGYRFLKSVGDNNTTLFFLDCTKSMNHALIFLLWSLIISILSTVFIFLVLVLISDRVAKPFAEAYEKQKIFISNAGHDIKTPLTIINADAELLELECGQSEWIDDIKKQSARMTSLTNELIYLTKMDRSHDIKAMPFPLSDVVEESVKSFSAVAATRNIEIIAKIPTRISFKGDENSLRKLINILFDNATKYTPSGEKIYVSLKASGRNVHFKISNPAEDLTEEMTERIFDRFYRTDSSRSTSGGFGIGLSVARAIVDAHKGKITAKKDKNDLVIEFIL